MSFRNMVDFENAEDNIKVDKILDEIEDIVNDILKEVDRNARDLDMEEIFVKLSSLSSDLY